MQVCSDSVWLCIDRCIHQERLLLCQMEKESLHQWSSVSLWVIRSVYCSSLSVCVLLLVMKEVLFLLSRLAGRGAEWDCGGYWDGVEQRDSYGCFIYSVSRGQNLFRYTLLNWFWVVFLCHCVHWDVNRFHLFCRSGAVQWRPEGSPWFSPALPVWGVIKCLKSTFCLLAFYSFWIIGYLLCS